MTWLGSLFVGLLMLWANCAQADFSGVCPANQVVAGPINGASKAPQCRLLTISDIPPGLSANPVGVVSPENYKQASDADDTASISRALATCNNVAFSNRTYVVSHVMYLCPGGLQSLFGYGGASIIKIASTWAGNTQINPPPSPAVPCIAATDSANWNPVFANPNCGGAVGTLAGIYPDKYINVSNLVLDATGFSSAASSGLIAVFFRNVQFAHVFNVVGKGFADCTAFLGSSDTLVDDSLCTTTSNAGFDHWDSPNNATLANNTVYCAPGGIYGYLYNASDTTGAHDGIAVNYSNVNNKSYGCNTGLYIDPLTTGGLVQNINVIGFIADALAGLANGVVITGHVSMGQVIAPVARDMVLSSSGGAIYLGSPIAPAGWTGIPDHVNIVSPQFINVSSGVAPLRILNSANTNKVYGASYTSTTTPYAVDVNGTGTYIEGTFPVGSSGLVNVNGTFPDFHQSNYANTSVSNCGGTPSIGGVANKSSITVGTGTVTSCEEDFPSGSWAYAPTCVATPQTAGDQLAVGSATAAKVVITSAANMATHILNVVCVQ